MFSTAVFQCAELPGQLYSSYDSRSTLGYPLPSDKSLIKERDGRDPWYLVFKWLKEADSRSCSMVNNIHYMDSKNCCCIFVSEHC